MGFKSTIESRRQSASDSRRGPLHVRRALEGFAMAWTGPAHAGARKPTLPRNESNRRLGECRARSPGRVGRTRRHARLALHDAIRAFVGGRHAARTTPSRGCKRITRGAFHLEPGGHDVAWSASARGIRRRQVEKKLAAAERHDDHPGGNAICVAVGRFHRVHRDFARTVHSPADCRTRLFRFERPDFAVVDAEAAAPGGLGESSL